MLNFVGTSACRKLVEFLSRLTVFRLGAKAIFAMLEETLVHLTVMTIPHWLRNARAQTNCLRPPYTSHLSLRSSTVRYRPTRPDHVVDLPEFTAHQPTSEDFLSADKKSASVRWPLSWSFHLVTQPVRERISTVGMKEDHANWDASNFKKLIDSKRFRKKT